MTMELFTILNTRSTPAEGLSRRRIWVRPGTPIILGAGLVMWLYVDRIEAPEGARYAPRVVIDGSGTLFCAYLDETSSVDLEGWAGMQLIPRALQCAPASRQPFRLLMEFVAMRQSIRWAI